MRKLYMTIAAFAALMFSQIGHAIPTIPGAIDVATDDSDTYYALEVVGNLYQINGYDANGDATGYSVMLTPDAYLGTDQQTLVGLAFDGTSFHILRDDLASDLVSTDSWSVVGFDLDGVYNGAHMELGPSPYVVPSLQSYVGLSIADEGYFALRDETATGAGFNTIGFDLVSGAWNGFAQAAPSVTGLNNIAAFNLSPVNLEFANSNASVPAPGTGLLLGSLLALGALRRKFA